MIRSIESKEKAELLCEGRTLRYEPTYMTDKPSIWKMLFQAF